MFPCSFPRVLRATIDRPMLAPCCVSCQGLSICHSQYTQMGSTWPTAVAIKMVVVLKPTPSRVYIKCLPLDGVYLMLLTIKCLPLVGAYLIPRLFLRAAYAFSFGLRSANRIPCLFQRTKLGCCDLQPTDNLVILVMSIICLELNPEVTILRTPKTNLNFGLPKHVHDKSQCVGS